MASETKDFFSPIEESKGGKTSYRTYATWFNKLGVKTEQYGVLAYIINSILYFENFERETAIFGFSVGSRNKEKVAFEKFEDNIPLSSIKSCYQVSKSAAERQNKRNDPTPLGEANTIEKIFNKLVTQIVTEDNQIYYFEVISHKEFIKVIKGE